MAEKKKEQRGKKERPLDKWTIKELREEALKLQAVQGVHGMNKEEILTVIRKAKGMAEPLGAKKAVNVREVKAKIGQLKQQRDREREEGATNNRLDILRRKISRLKKQTRS